MNWRRFRKRKAETPEKNPPEMTVFTPIELLLVAEIGRFSIGYSNCGKYYKKREIAEEAKTQPLRNLTEDGILEVGRDNDEFIKYSLTPKGREIYDSLLSQFAREIEEAKQNESRTD